MREYLQHVADRRLGQLGIEPVYGSKNPFAFMPRPAAGAYYQS